MSHPTQSFVRNTLLSALASEDYALLRPHLDTVSLAKGFVISRPGERIVDAYFPESCLGSILANSPLEENEVEIGLFGRDGMSGVPIIHYDDRSSHHYLIQIEGVANRIDAGALRRAIDTSGTLLATLLQFAQVLWVQTGQTALSNAKHSIEVRLARWLLMCADRIGGDEMALTHEFLSLMLAVRRPSVTVALHVLEVEHLIGTHRGRITIRDRAGLERFAADAYGVPEAEYLRLIGSPPATRFGYSTKESFKSGLAQPEAG